MSAKELQWDSTGNPSEVKGKEIQNLIYVKPTIGKAAFT